LACSTSELTFETENRTDIWQDFLDRDGPIARPLTVQKKTKRDRELIYEPDGIPKRDLSFRQDGQYSL